VVEAAQLVDEIRLTIADLRASWSWLAELVVPGPESRAAPVLSDTERTRRAATVAAERAERYRPGAWTKLGQAQYRREDLGALAAAAIPTRLTVVDAQLAVRGIVLSVAARLARHLGAEYVGGRSGDAAVDDALEWMAGGPLAWVVARDGTAWRRPAGGALLQLRDATVAADVDRRLRRADKLARAQAGVEGEPVVPFGHPCPACGRSSLQWHMPRPDPRYRRDWSVRCMSEGCICAGQGCGCRQHVRYEGRRHAWSYGELDGPYGLWHAIAMASGPRRRLRQDASGHGGWSERRRGVADPGRSGPDVLDHS